MEEKKFAPLIKGLKDRLTVTDWESERAYWGKVWIDVHRTKVGNPYKPTKRNLRALCSLAGIPPEMAINHLVR